MGYIYNQSLIITGYDKNLLTEVREKAKSYFGDEVTEMVSHKYNGESSFFIPSSGSKIGWDAYDEHLDKIKQFSQWIRETSAFELLLSSKKYTVEEWRGHRIIGNYYESENYMIVDLINCIRVSYGEDGENEKIESIR